MGRFGKSLVAMNDWLDRTLLYAIEPWRDTYHVGALQHPSGIGEIRHIQGFMSLREVTAPPHRAILGLVMPYKETFAVPAHRNASMGGLRFALDKDPWHEATVNQPDM
jgi:hypothetical protein